MRSGTHLYRYLTSGYQMILVLHREARRHHRCCDGSRTRSRVAFSSTALLCSWLHCQQIRALVSELGRQSSAFSVSIYVSRGAFDGISLRCQDNSRLKRLGIWSVLMCSRSPYPIKERPSSFTHSTFLTFTPFLPAHTSLSNLLAFHSNTLSPQSSRACAAMCMTLFITEG